MRTRRIPIQHATAINHPLPPTRISPFLDLVLAVEVRAGNVEAVDVARDDAGDEEDGVDDCVGAGAGDHENCDGRAFFNREWLVF